jgi:hypothetical protein
MATVKARTVAEMVKELPAEEGAEGWLEPALELGLAPLALVQAEVFHEAGLVFNTTSVHWQKIK